MITYLAKLIINRSQRELICDNNDKMICMAFLGGGFIVNYDDECE